MNGRTGLVIAALVVAAGCKGAEPPKQPLGATPMAGTGGDAALMQPPKSPHLDSGNIAFRAKNYDLALAHYRAAAKDAPLNAAPWYGIYMVAEKKNDKALADSALRAVKSLEGTDSSVVKHPMTTPAPKKTP